MELDNESYTCTDTLKTLFGGQEVEGDFYFLFYTYVHFLLIPEELCARCIIRKHREIWPFPFKTVLT